MRDEELTDFYAGLAMMALIQVYKDDRSGSMLKEVAKSSYLYADALMDERKRRDYEERTSC